MKRITILILFFTVVLLWACENKKLVSQENSQTWNKVKVTNQVKTVVKKNTITEIKKSMSGNIVKKDTTTWDVINNLKNIKTKTNLQNNNKTRKISINLNTPTFSSTKVYSWEKISKYSWSFSMKKPKLSEMTNWNSILHWFHKVWAKKVKISRSDAKSSNEKENYDNGTKGNSFCVNTKNNEYDMKLTPENVKKLKEWKFYITVTWEYNWDGYYYSKGYSKWWLGLLKCTSKQLKFFKKHGWFILNPNWNTVNYSKEIANDIMGYWFNEEWNNFVEAIGWNSDPTKRYPYNTVYISSDLLLHIFHKVFDNELKYKEESELRKKVWEIAQVEFKKYKNKYIETTTKKLKNIYGFLVSYEAIESSLLLPQDGLLWKQTYSIKNPNDKEIREKVLSDLKSKILFLPQETQKKLIDELNLIFKAEDIKVDPLIKYFFPNDKEFRKLNIKQDFTQFRPRGHYTSDSLLKTYFMWMKWLMREKFYFKSQNLAEASLILAKNLDNNELWKLKEIQNFVVKLIGGDDDVNVFDLRKFTKDNNLITDQDIINKFNKNIQNKLLNLKEQKIISTSYSTSTVWKKTEKQAHDDTVGFAFFGEKFTIDSWIFDKLTAWSAEKEWQQKTKITTALVVPYILNNNSIAGKLTKVWLQENVPDTSIKNQKITNYLNIAKKLIQKVQYFNFTKNIYSQWLDTLNYVFVKTNGKKPYWENDSFYKLRKLLTYMWSYTELKHDTLLYVKQEYKGLWWWSDDDPCVYIPKNLSVPKWYVEPDIDLIDKLIKLSDETNKFMKSYQFTSLTEKLKFLKQIALAEIKNQKISDKDFEKLRLIDFTNILTPNDFIWQALEKEERWAIIWDIFNSAGSGVLYEALWRPNLILMMIKDRNGSRVVLWPVYSYYEFYKPGKRYTDEEWQAGYDKKFKNNKKLESLEYRLLEKMINK